MHLGKDRIKGKGKNLKPILYGPFGILKKIGDNACQLELPGYMELYSVFNFDKLKPFKPSMLDDEIDETLPAVDDLVIKQETVLHEDIIIERKSSSTRRGKRMSYWIGHKG